MGITRLWVIVMLITLQRWWCDGCLEEERIALLQLKASLDHLKSDSLSDWVRGGNCCKWTGVHCNTTTGRATKLTINAIRDPKDWYLNTSLFLSFKELRSLHLYGNGIAGCVKNQGFERLSVLNYLEDLDLSANNLDGNILSSLSALSSLKKLSLVGNKIQGSIDIEELNNLTSLKELDLGYNNIKGFKSFQGKKEVLKLKNLEFLYLNHNFLDTNILSQLSGLSSLVLLNLSKNQLKGSINISGGEGLLQLNNLQLLDLGHNHFNNSILSSLKDLSSLKYLYLNNNQLEGALHMEGICEFKHLEWLYMDNNNLNGELPSCLANLTSLRLLSLSSNNLKGQIPSFMSKMGLLSVIDLSNNQLQRAIPITLSNWSSLSILDLSNNSLSGRLPEWMGNMSNLRYLALSQNHFFGTLPHRFNSPFLEHLDLSENNISGSLSRTFYNCSKLATLDVRNNNFMGGIPEKIGLLSNLRFLLLSYNNFEGEIPIELCKLDQLRVIDLSNNNFSGHIQPCILSTTNPQSQYMVSPSEGLVLTAKNASYVYRGLVLRYVFGIDLSCNNLKGEIPHEFGKLDYIQILNLSHNSLTGEIPQTFSNLKEIETLDLSFNNLNGSIPPQLIRLCSLSSFSVAHNNLSGRTPIRMAQFGTFEEVSYRDNPFLCGPPLPKSCSENISPPSIPENSVGSESKDELIDMNVFRVTFLGSYSMIFLTVSVVLYINPQWRRASFYLVEQKITKCYYFVVDNIPFLSKLGFP